jgi:DNA-binding response OmpR family regulator
MTKRILVLEKDEDILHIIGQILNDEGYDVKLLQTDRDFIVEVEFYQPHIILLDVIKITPEGTAICQDLKNSIDFNHIPVIVLSTAPKAEVVKEICADEVVKKPFDIDFLLRMVEKQLKAA